MKSARILISALFLLLTQPATAGALYGTVLIRGAPASGVEILVACPGFANQTAAANSTTDGRGSYSLGIRASGRCQMQVRRGAQAGAVFEVFISENTIRFDFEIDAALTRVR